MYTAWNKNLMANDNNGPLLKNEKIMEHVNGLVTFTPG